MTDHCQHHEDHTKEIAAMKAAAESRDAWITKIEQRMEEQHKETILAITSLRADINKAKGAGWMLISLGSLATGVVGYVLKGWVSK